MAGRSLNPPGVLKALNPPSASNRSRKKWTKFSPCKPSLSTVSLSPMKKAILLLLLLTLALCSSGQEDSISLDDLVQSAQQWAKENLDEDALRVLQSADQDKIKQFFKDIQKEFHGEYVMDLASLKDAAKAIV